MLKKIRQTLKKKGGFSLIELLVVIAIMGVIALVAIPNVVSAIDNSKKNTDKANASAIATAITAAKAGGASLSDTGTDHDTKATFTSSLTAVVPTYLQSAPTVKFKGTNGAVNDDTFYYSLVSGEIRVYVNTGTSTSKTYIQLFPSITSGSAWDN